MAQSSQRMNQLARRRLDCALLYTMYVVHYLQSIHVNLLYSVQTVLASYVQ